MDDEPPIDISRRRRRSAQIHIDMSKTSGMTVAEQADYRQRQALLSPIAEVFIDRVRIVNMFENAGVLIMSDLVALSIEELLALPNFGEKTFKEVADITRSLGLSTTWTHMSKKDIQMVIREMKKKDDSE